MADCCGIPMLMAKPPTPRVERLDRFGEHARVRVSKAPVETGTSSPRPYLLPEDLPNALRWLADDELETLAKCVSMERRRRSLPAAEDGDTAESPIPAPRTVSANLTRRLSFSSSRLTQSRINAIRAAFKAGVKLSMIARQFGVSQAAIRDALSD